MTDDRIKELRSHYDDWTQSIGDAKNEVEECLDEIERLKAMETLATRKQLADLKELDVQADHIRRLREALQVERECYRRGIEGCVCVSCCILAETEPERGYQPRNPTPLDPITLKPPTGCSGVVEPR